MSPVLRTVVAGFFPRFEPEVKEGGDAEHPGRRVHSPNHGVAPVAIESAPLIEQRVP